MRDGFISGVGGYLPLLRLDRGATDKALRFSGLGGRGAGYRPVAGWDEDPVTLAVEAARGLPASTRTSDVAGSRRCGIPSGAIWLAMSG